MSTVVKVALIIGYLTVVILMFFLFGYLAKDFSVPIKLVSDLAWPVVVIFISLIFANSIEDILKSFSGLGNRVKKLAVPGVLNFDCNNENDLSASNTLTGQNKLAKFQWENIIIRKQKRLIYSKLIEDELSQEEAIHVLVEELSHTNLLLRLSNINANLTQEETEMLLYLNSSEPQLKTDLHDLFRNSEHKIEISLNRLLKFELIIKNDQGKYGISYLGREYLVALVQEGMPLLSKMNTDEHE